MKKAKYAIKLTSKFRKDYKQVKKRGFECKLLEEVVELLAQGKPLEEKRSDHSLHGSQQGHRECHIQPDWLLIYYISEDVLVLTLTRTGTHSDLFS